MKTPRPNGYKDRQHINELMVELGAADAEIHRALSVLAKDPLLAVNHLAAVLKATATARVIAQEIAEIHKHWSEKI